MVVRLSDAEQATEQQSTEELLELALAGNERAIVELMWLEYDRLIAYITPLVPQRLVSQIAPDDILQETLTVAWLNIGSLELVDRCSFVAWLRTIARRKLLDRVRASNRQRRGGTKAATHQDGAPEFRAQMLLDIVAADGRSPSSFVAGSEAEAHLRIALAELKSRYREVIQYRFLDGMSAGSAARKLKCSEGAVHMLTQRALKKLRAILGNESRFFSGGRH